MDVDLTIDKSRCVSCGRCVTVCPTTIFSMGEGGVVETSHINSCIGCGHCVDACAEGAVVHSLFPEDRIHRVDYERIPSAESFLELCLARRSNRAFSTKKVPQEMLNQILLAAHAAPTASNSQQLSFTVVSDPQKLRAISEFTLDVFSRILKLLKNPLVKPILKRMKPELYKMIPNFERLNREYAEGKDRILRGAQCVIFFHEPVANRFGCEDANLSYQNASLMAEVLGVSQFYMGFVLSAIKQDKHKTLEAMFGIQGRIAAAMALGMPRFRYPNRVDRKEIEVKEFIE